MQFSIYFMNIIRKKPKKLTITLLAIGYIQTYSYSNNQKESESEWEMLTFFVSTRMWIHHNARLICI